MADRLKKTSRFAGWCYAAWTFIKAQLSSYVAGLMDFLVTVLLVKLSGLFYLYATFLGSVVGGMMNCAINYSWVFHADDCKRTRMVLRCPFVWGGSILLNTWDTFALTGWLTGIRWVGGLLGHYINNVFILSRIIVAVSIAFFWNYHLQRIFIYRNHNLRRFIRQYFRDRVELI